MSSCVYYLAFILYRLYCDNTGILICSFAICKWLQFYMCTYIRMYICMIQEAKKSPADLLDPADEYTVNHCLERC